MTAITNELMFEVLKSMQQDLGRVRSDLREVKAEVQAVRSYAMGIQQDIGNIYATLGEHAERLDRIETRLLEPAH